MAGVMESPSRDVDDTDARPGPRRAARSRESARGRAADGRPEPTGSRAPNSRAGGGTTEPFRYRSHGGGPWAGAIVIEHCLSADAQPSEVRHTLRHPTDTQHEEA
ncbi:hypothetical protein GCM10018987_42450 [Streptomyces cremeus]